jgi:hypothetical protein
MDWLGSGGEGSSLWKSRSICGSVVVQFGKEASQTRDYCVAKNATHRAARPDPSLRKKRLLRMTITTYRPRLLIGQGVLG